MKPALFVLTLGAYLTTRPTLLAVLVGLTNQEV